MVGEGAKSGRCLGAAVIAARGIGVLLAACSDGGAVGGKELAATSGPEPAYLSEELDGCLFASPLFVTSGTESFVLVAPSLGRLSALDMVTGEEVWGLTLPVREGLRPLLLSTPVQVDDKLVVAYQGFDPEVSEEPLSNRPSRMEHRVVVVDLEARALDEDFEPFVVEAEVPALDVGASVEFNPPTQLSRAALRHARPRGSQLGKVYVAYGNKGDIQPWHGWVFELDLDAWREHGPQAARSGVLLTTPQADCGPAGESGMRDMVCGGGVWTPAGPQLFETDDGFELLIPTGNGHTDLARGSYANALLRVGPGLSFEANCDAELCAGFDPAEPAIACLESCENVFVPRLAEGDSPLSPGSGACDGLSLFECYAQLDYDFGANAPVRLELDGGAHAYLQPGKDGYAYLIDGERMGRMLDRVKLVETCGAQDDPCEVDWAGMSVTQPLVVEVEGESVILTSTFVYDRTHPAGVVALTLNEDNDGPRLGLRWQAPSFDEPEATERFRSHPSRLAVSDGDGEPVAWIVDVRGFKAGDEPGNDSRREAHGWLLGIRVSDGEIVARKPLWGRGQRYLVPLVTRDKIYVGSCTEDEGPSRLEGHLLTLD